MIFLQGIIKYYFPSHQQLIILMLTKTGQLLMRKKNELSQNKSGPIKFQPPERMPQPQARPSQVHNRISHVTHLNQYNFISLTNKHSQQLQANKELLKQLEVQNLRLIEENMKLVEWAKHFLDRTRQNLMRIIQGIEDFKYLESVNKLYEVIGELTEYEDSGFREPRAKTKEHYLTLKKLNNPESKRLLPVELDIRRFINFTYVPTSKPSNHEPMKEEVPSPTFLNLKKQGDFSDFEPNQREADLMRILLLQSISLETAIDLGLR